MKKIKRTAARRQSPALKRENPQTLAPRLQRLMQAILAAPSRPESAAISHEECMALLDFYVDSERRGENARALYPAIAKHLQTCDRCRAFYEWLTRSLAEETMPEPGPHLNASAKSALPFLIPFDPNAAWTKQVRSRIGGAPLGFAFTINPSYLARVIAPPAQVAVRGQSITDRSLLLSDSIALGSRNVAVELWIHRPERSDYVDLEISIVSSSPLPEPLHVKLRWNDRQYAAAIERGQGWINQIPVSDLENARLSVEFQAGQPGTSAEG